MSLHRQSVRPVFHLSIFLGILAFLLPLATAQSSKSHPWMNTSLSPDERASMVVKEMTLDEKISMLHGTGMPGLGPVSPLAVHSNGGAGYVRLDWFTPNGLSTWGDGRLTILGTEGYIELRKYVDIAGRPGGDHLFIVDQKETRYIDCKDGDLPFGPRLVSDIVNRTETAMPQAHTFLTMELVIKAQKQAQTINFRA